MTQYDKFVDRGETRWLPYLMYFHQADYSSEAINTDRLGFRLGGGPHGKIVTADGMAGPVGVLAGSSTAFGVGASCDSATLSSQLSLRSGGLPWVNFGGRGYSSTQEYLLYALHQDLVPKTEHIIILSGLNNLGLSGLPRHLQADYTPFFFSAEYFAQMEEVRARHRPKPAKGRSRLASRRARPPANEPADALGLEERVDLAAARTSQDIARWRRLAPSGKVRMSFVLQPLATWVRDGVYPAEEESLFGELDGRVSGFWRLFGEVSGVEVWREYSHRLRQMCASYDTDFVDLIDELRTEAERWLYVDRAHFNDDGYSLMADMVADRLHLGHS